MQTNILDWLEATSARCPDAPAVGIRPLPGCPRCGG